MSKWNTIDFRYVFHNFQVIFALLVLNYNQTIEEYLEYFSVFQVHLGVWTAKFTNKHNLELATT